MTWSESYSLEMAPFPLPSRGSLHHVELRVASSDTSISVWEWLLLELGYHEYQTWTNGATWKLGDTYLVVEQTTRIGAHDRRSAGLSHLAFHADDQADVDQLWDAAPAHGWAHLYDDRHPWAGGQPAGNSPGHYAAFLENDERFKVEIVASRLTR